MTALPDPSTLRALLDEASALPGLGEAEPLRRLSADYARGLSERERPLAIALIGATGAGKSTLLNALAGRTLAVEGSDRPTSRKVTVYAPDDLPVAAFEALRAEVKRYALRDGAPWAGQVFVDTPDLNSVEPGHRELARGALELCDAALVVMHRGSVAEAVQAEFLQGFARRRRLLFVLNHADQLGAAAQGELKAQVVRLATEKLEIPADEVRVFAISALEAKVLSRATPDFLALIDALRALAAAEAARRVREGNAAAALAGLKAQVSAALEGTARAQREVAEALGRGFEEARAALEADFAARVEAAGAHLGTEVRRQAAARWWGPSAWWMRLSLLGAGGLGAASLVARVNLPAGLAVAATSTALSKLQEKTRAAAAEERVVAGGDDDGDVAVAARAVVAPARAEALRRGVAPELLEVPDADGLRASLRAVRADAWRYTQDRAVGETVGRWWRWARFLLLPLVNLPLFALLVDVGYRAIRAYLYGPYLGADFFLNAAMVGLALSGAGAVLASLTLAGLAQRVRRAGKSRFARGLDQEIAARLQAVERALEGPRSAASRLVAKESAGG